MSIVNTDNVNGKIVKVRFRGAANSEDLLDFQVFLSPSDVWTASLTQGADGKTLITVNGVQIGWEKVTSIAEPVKQAANDDTATSPDTEAAQDPPSETAG